MPEKELEVITIDTSSPPSTPSLRIPEKVLEPVELVFGSSTDDLSVLPISDIPPSIPTSLPPSMPTKQPDTVMPSPREPDDVAPNPEISNVPPSIQEKDPEQVSMIDKQVKPSIMCGILKLNCRSCTKKESIMPEQELKPEPTPEKEEVVPFLPNPIEKPSEVHVP